MARDDLFRRSFEAGTAFLDMTRERAEALVKDLVKAGEVQKGKTQKVIDELLERSRKGAEELRQLIRGEISEQVAALGLATKEDVGRIEARLAAMASPASPSGGSKPSKAAPAKRAGKDGAAAKVAPAPRKSTAAAKASGAGVAKKTGAAGATAGGGRKKAVPPSSPPTKAG